jgi:hypothetical protein
MSSKNLSKFLSEQTKYIATIPEDIKNSVAYYGYDGYRAVNRYLETGEIIRGADRDTVITTIKHLDVIIENAPPLKGDIVVYRGINLPTIQSKRYASPSPLINFTGKHKGFVSTSLDEGVSSIFLENKCCMLKITVPKNKKALYLSGATESAEEEVLFARNSIIEIVSFEGNIINAKLV